MKMSKNKYRTIIICKQCGAKFDVLLSRKIRKFCSCDCYHLYVKENGIVNGKKNAMFGINAKKHPCFGKGKKLLLKQYNNMNIDKQMTFKKFGYYPEGLCKNSHLKIIAICKDCRNSREIEFRQYRDLCEKCSKSKKLSEETKEKIRQSNSGEFYYGWNPERHEKHYCIELDCNNEIHKHTTLYRSGLCKSCAQKGERNVSFGKVTHGKWGKYKGINMRSSWEIAYAKYLDKQGIKWKYESKTFDLGNTTYTPDFYLPKTNEYIEIKGYWRDDAKLKFKKFKRIYNFINIKIIDKNKINKYL